MSDRRLYLARIAYPHDPDMCFLWLGSRNGNGYGQLTIDGKTVGAHRYTLLRQGLPPFPGAQAAHSCHVRACVNPRHLSWQTRRENTADAVHRNARALTWELVAQIRAWRSEGVKGKEIAKRLGVSEGSVSMAARGITWREDGRS